MTDEGGRHPWMILSGVHSIWKHLDSR